MTRDPTDPTRSVTLPPDWLWRKEVMALSSAARWHFLGLITYCADFRHYDGDMMVNKARNLAIDWDCRDETLEELERKGFIGIDGRELWIVDVEQYMPARAIRERLTSHFLYRLFDADGNLLYVGRTWNVKQRLQEHARVQPWWAEVASHTIERKSSFDELCHAEKVAIAAESPRCNVVRDEWLASKLKAS